MPDSDAHTVLSYAWSEEDNNTATGAVLLDTVTTTSLEEIKDEGVIYGVHFLANETNNIELVDQNATDSENWTSGWFTGAPFNDSNSSCDAHILQYRIVPALILGSCFVVGVFCCVVGYRFLKVTMFVTGFVFGASIVYFFCVEEGFLPAAGQIGAAVGSGLLCGILAVFIIYIGLFGTGFSFGTLLTIASFIVIEQFYHTTTKWIPIGVALGVAIVSGIVTMLRWRTPLVIASSSLLGSALILAAIDYYVDLFRATLYAYLRMSNRLEGVGMDFLQRGGLVGEMCWFSWIIYACWPVLFVISILIQWRVTAADVDHFSPQNVSPRVSKRKDGSNVPLSPQDNYRHLYKVRRANGDVVSKSYMLTIQNQLSPSLRLLNPMPTTADNSIIDDPNVVMTQAGDIVDGE